MNHDPELPPIPAAGDAGSQGCAVVGLYLALLDDLSPEQVQAVFRHLAVCAHCTQELQRLRRTTRLVASLPASEPSPQVDQAILAALAAHREEQVPPRTSTDASIPVSRSEETAGTSQVPRSAGGSSSAGAGSAHRDPSLEPGSSWRRVWLCLACHPVLEWLCGLS